MFAIYSGSLILVVFIHTQISIYADDFLIKFNASFSQLILVPILIMLSHSSFDKNQLLKSTKKSIENIKIY